MNSARPFFVRGFLSAADAQVLAEWILTNRHQPFFQDARMRGRRVTTRYSDEGFAFPAPSFAARRRLQQVFERYGAVAAPFKDGMVASCAYPGDTCFSHVDPVWVTGHTTVHCNVIVSAPESGGDAVISGAHFTMPERDLLCYPVSALPHETTRVGGSRPRLMWVFGFCVPNTADWSALETALSHII